MPSRIPVTVLTGFLGAGKTTLLNRLLRLPEMSDTAVLINEFGEVGLDHLLVERLDDETVLLNAGCLCCTVRGDLVHALEDLARRVADGQKVARVIVETTGLADPAPVLQTLMAEPSVLRAFRLDSVLTLVDAVNGAATLDAHPEAVKQVAMADRLVVSKTDLASPEAVASLEIRLQRLNPGAAVRRVVLGEAGCDILAAAGPYDPSAKAPEVAAWLDAEAWAKVTDHDHAPGHDHGHHHGHHAHAQDRNRHDAHIQAFCLTYDTPLSMQGLASWLEMMVATRGAALLRVKCLLNLAGETQPVVLHAVQHVFHEPTRLAAWPPGHDRRSRLVFIVRDLPRQAVEEGLNAFLAAEPTNLQGAETP